MITMVADYVQSLDGPLCTGTPWHVGRRSSCARGEIIVTRVDRLDQLVDSCWNRDLLATRR